MRIASARVHEALATGLCTQRRRIGKRPAGVLGGVARICGERLVPFLEHRLLHHGRQVGHCLFWSEARSEPADHVDPQKRGTREVGSLATEQWLSRERHREVGRLRHVQCAGKAFTRDADDDEGDLVDEDGLSHDVRIAIEAPAPVLVRDGRHRRSAGRVVGVGQRPAARCADAEPTKVVARHVLPGDHIGTAVDDDVELLERIEREQLGQGAVGLLQPAERGIREGRARGTARRLVRGPDAIHALAHALTALEPVEQHEFVGRRDRQRLEQQFVHDAEQGGVHADADRQRQDGGEREPGIAAQLSRGVAQVLDGVAEPGQRIHVTRALASARHAAELAVRLAPGLLRRHARADVFLDALLDVEAGFLVERLVRVRVQERGGEPANPSHGVNS